MKYYFLKEESEIFLLFYIVKNNLLLMMWWYDACAFFNDIIYLSKIDNSFLSLATWSWTLRCRPLVSSGLDTLHYVHSFIPLLRKEGWIFWVSWGFGEWGFGLKYKCKVSGGGASADRGLKELRRGFSALPLDVFLKFFSLWSVQNL